LKLKSLSGMEKIEILNSQLSILKREESPAI
jgi:hypothetical protein